MTMPTSHPAESDPPQTHTCPCGCPRPVADRMFSCPTGWRRLPHRLRSPILQSPRGTLGHREAMASAVEWFRANPAPDRPQRDE
jgi:hypothetical protein